MDEARISQSVNSSPSPTTETVPWSMAMVKVVVLEETTQSMRLMLFGRDPTCED